MTQTIAIARRELTSLFCSPIAYVVLGLFGLGLALIFFGFSFAPGMPAELRDTYTWTVWLLIFLVPAISMRLVSEELRSGTIEPLMTAPLSDAQVIVGKWIGAMGFVLALLILPTVVLMIVLESNASPDYGPMLTGLLGLILVAGFYLSIGTFASAVTRNQIIAFLLTIFIISLFTLALYFLPRASFVSPDLSKALSYMNVNNQFEDFSKGLIDTGNFVYFFSGIALFLFFAIKALEVRRWW